MKCFFLFLKDRNSTGEEKEGNPKIWVKQAKTKAMSPSLILSRLDP